MPRQPTNLKDRIILNENTIWLHPPQADCYICRGNNHVYLDTNKREPKYLFKRKDDGALMSLDTAFLVNPEVLARDYILEKEVI